MTRGVGRSMRVVIVGAIVAAPYVVAAWEAARG
jgi:hypothetical protein